MWEYQVRRWLPLWFSEPEGGQTIKKARTDITDVVSQGIIKFLEEFTDLTTSVTGRNRLKVNPQNIIYSYYLRCLIKVIMLYYVMKQLSIISSTRNTSTKWLSLELHQNLKIPMKYAYTIVKWTSGKIIGLHLIRRSKKLWM